MGTWASRGLRGSELESTINFTIEQYRFHKLALIQKIPTPITPVKLDGHGHISLAYFDQKSTVDYIGIAQGVPICFDAKECKKDTFPLANIHEHQMKFMEEFEEQGGVTFFLLHYSERKTYYYLSYSEANWYWRRMQNGGRKSFRYDELDENCFLTEKHNGMINILEGIQRHLDLKSDDVQKLKTVKASL